MTILEGPDDGLPPSRILLGVPAHPLGGFFRGVRCFLFGPPPLVGSQAQDVGHLRLEHRTFEVGVLSVEAVRHYRAERYGRCSGVLHQFRRDLGLGPKGGIAPSLLESLGGRVRLHVQRMVDPPVGPHATHRDDPVGYRAYGSQILVADVIRMRAVLAVSGLVDDQHASLLVRPRGRVLLNHPQSASVYLPRVPVRLREEKLQPLGRSALGSHDGFHTGQRGKRLVAVSGQQQPLQVLTEPPSLGKSTEEIIEAGRVSFQRTGSRWARQTFAHLVTPPTPLKHHRLRLTNYRLDTFTLPQRRLAPLRPTSKPTALGMM